MPENIPPTSSNNADIGLTSDVGKHPMSEDNTTTNPSENSQGNPADVPKKKSLAGKALTGFSSAYREVGEEAQAETHQFDVSSGAHSALFLRLSLWLFKIPILSDALIAVAPPIKWLVDKIPLGIFPRRIREKIEKNPGRLTGTTSVFMASANLIGFIGLRIAFPLIMLVLALVGIGSALSGNESEFESAKSDMTWAPVIFWVFYAIYIVYALFTLYVSIAIIRIKRFVKSNISDVRDVVLSTIAVVLTIVLLVMMKTAASDFAKLLAEKS